MERCCWTLMHVVATVRAKYMAIAATPRKDRRTTRRHLLTPLSMLCLRSSVFVEGSQTRGEGVEKAFWMVESCRSEWSETAQEMDCKNSSNFYPVSDTDTGVVYSNEHCAVCNSVVSLVHWRYSLVCSDVLLNLTMEPNFTLTLEVLQANCQPCSYVEPAPFVLTSTGLLAPLPRPCHLNTASCLSREHLESLTPQEWTEGQYNALVENCTAGPYSLVRESFLKYILFRNQYCALCNGIQTGNLVCASNESLLNGCTYSSGTPSSPPTIPPNYYYGSGDQEPPPTAYIILDDEDDGSSFSLVLDIFGNGQVVVDSETISITVTVICSEGEVFDPVLGDCRQTVCPEGFTLNEVTCQFSSGGVNYTSCPGGLVTLNSSEVENINNNTLLFNGTEYIILLTDPLGRPIVCLSTLSCLRYIALTLEDEYEYVDNSTILYNEEEHQIAYFDLLGQPVICSPFSVNGTQEVNVTILKYSYPGGFVELTYIGCSLSVLGCALILLTYSLFKELRTVPSKILMNLSVAILISNLFILFSGLGKVSQDLCTATAIILHLFFLAQFSWMSIMIFEMGRTFNRARKLAQSSSQAYKTKVVLVYMLIGWIVPAIIVGASVAVNFTTDNLVLYGKTEDGREGSCWMNHLESALVAFVAPVALAILFNALVLVFISIWLFKAWRTQAKLHKEQNVPYLRVYLAVVSITGLTWVFGFLAIVAGTSWSWYPFIILNSSQGFLIFLGFLLTRKVASRYLACLTCGKVAGIPVPSTKEFSMKFRTRKTLELQSTSKSDSNTVHSKIDTNTTNTPPPV